MSKFEKMTAEPQTSRGVNASVETVLQALCAPEAGEALSLMELQALLAATVRAYAALRETDKDLAAFPQDSDVSATEVAIATTGLLDAADMAAFELGMWQTLKN